jgi:hypothetical protein
MRVHIFDARPAKMYSSIAKRLGIDLGKLHNRRPKLLTTRASQSIGELQILLFFIMLFFLLLSVIIYASTIAASIFMFDRNLQDDHGYPNSEV